MLIISLLSGTPPNEPQYCEIKAFALNLTTLLQIKSMSESVRGDADAGGVMQLTLCGGKLQHHKGRVPRVPQLQ